MEKMKKMKQIIIKRKTFLIKTTDRKLLIKMDHTTIGKDKQVMGKESLAGQKEKTITEKIEIAIVLSTKKTIIEKIEIAIDLSIKKTIIDKIEIAIALNTKNSIKGRDNLIMSLNNTTLILETNNPPAHIPSQINTAILREILLMTITLLKIILEKINPISIEIKKISKKAGEMMIEKVAANNKVVMEAITSLSKENTSMTEAILKTIVILIKKMTLQKLDSLEIKINQLIQKKLLKPIPLLKNGMHIHLRRIMRRNLKVLLNSDKT